MSIFEQNNNSDNQNKSELRDEHLEINEPLTQLPTDKKNQSSKKIGMIFIVTVAVLLILFIVPKFFSSSEKIDEPTKQESETKKGTTAYIKPKEKEVIKPFAFQSYTNQNEQITSNYQGQKLGEEKPIKTQFSKSLGSMMVVKETISKSSDSTEKSTLPDSIYTSNKYAQDLNRQLNDIKSGEKTVDNIVSNNDSNLFSAPIFKPTAAKKMKFNPNLLLSQGTYIPCVMRGRLVSNISGQLSCIITDNVFSSNGNVLLIEKGSIATGFYQGASIKHGFNEIFAVWQEIRTPNGLTIPIDSGSTDPLGANGLSGYVDNHFWERFSNAIVLSMIQDASGALTSNLSDKTQQNTESTRQASNDIAKTVLEQMGDIAPTLYKNQGDKIGLFVARDIDFSNVYELKIGK